LFDEWDLPEPETLYDDYSSRAHPADHADMKISEMPDYNAPDAETERERKKVKYQKYAKHYLATIKAFDDNVGELLDHLDQTGLAENTVVIYTSDNGMFVGDHGWFDKRFMYEESLHIPLLVRYPKEIPAGTVSDQHVLNLDFPETFLDYAGVSTPEEMQGRSLRPLLQGKQVRDWRDSLYYHFYESDGPGNVEKHYGVRTERYKLIYFYTLAADETPWEMYDLQKDPYEMDNVYNDPSYAETRQFLKEELKRLRAQYEDDTGVGVNEHSTDIEEKEEGPGNVQLAQNYPNPFNPATRIRFTLPTSQRVELKVYNSMGGEVRTLVDGKRPAGQHTVRFNGINLSNGVYFYKLETEGASPLTRKMILMK
jgi:arylsulfatase A-like enzyme